MPDLPAFSALFRIGRDEVLVRNALVSRDAVEREGTDANILIAAAAAMADEVVGQLADLAASLYLDSAVEKELDHLLFDRYGLTRKSAAASIGSVAFRTTLPSATTFAIPKGVLLQTAGGTQFITTEAATFTVATVGPVVMAVRSVLAGPAQSAKAGTITSIASQIAGAPSDLVVSNPYATTGADAEETDDSFRERGRRFFVTARRGTLKAIEAAALGIPGIRKASAFEVIDSSGRPARAVQLVVADAFAEQYVDYTTVPPRYETQSQAIASQIYAALADVRAAGMYVNVVVANVVVLPIQLTLTFQAGADVNTAALNARSTITSYVNSLAPGAAFSAVAALNVLQTVQGLSFTGGELYSPPGDVVVKPLQVLRTSLGLVSAVAAQTDTAIATGINPDSYTVA
jgi:hypothetical protein